MLRRLLLVLPVVLAALLVPILPVCANVAPTVGITSPVDCAWVPYNWSYEALIEAEADDPDGSIVAVRFYSQGTLCGVDSFPPYASWCPLTVLIEGTTPGPNLTAGPGTDPCFCSTTPLLVHPVVTPVWAVAVDDLGATASTETLRVVPAFTGPLSAGTSLPLLDPDFESVPLADGGQVAGPGMIGGWTFEGTAGAALGVLNPTAADYPGAEGNGTPLRAGGANIAFLAVPAGTGDSAHVFQVLPDTLRRYSRYWLQILAGAPLAEPPYTDLFPGARFELRAGGTVIAQGRCDSRWQHGEFHHLTAIAVTDHLPPELVGQGLSIHVVLNGGSEARSVHFDRVSLRREGYRPPGVPVEDGPPAARLVARAIPNPATGAATVEFLLPAPGRVELALFDPAGRSVGSPAVHELPAGVHRLPLPAVLAPGIYFAHLNAGPRQAAIRFVRLGR